MKSLPPGFRFHPTDEELILHYLRKRLTSTPLPVSIIAEVDIYKFDPWDLPAKAEFGEKEWYFFSPRDRKYPNGARPNRAAASGYWKATGTDKTIVSAGLVVGVKKALVFYKGRPPKGVKTNWIMHEYRLSDHPYSSNIAKPIIINHNNNSSSSSMRLDDWVLCRIYKKTNAVHPITIEPSDHEEEEPFPQETFKPQKSCSFSNLLDAMDYSILSSLLSDSFDHSIPGSATGSGCSDPPFFDTCPTSSNNNNNNNNYYIMQKVPQTQLSAQTSTENRLKRQLPDDQQQYLLSPPKKYASPCSFVSSAIQPDIPQNNIMNQLFLNQQLFLSPEL